jgi:adenylyltransferase/sulfurtransferase
VEIEADVADVDSTNIESYATDADLILDGTDNFETRFLINDLSLKHKLPWVYGGCLGAEGQTLTIIPGVTPCLRCLIQEPPPPGESPTCDTAGILGPIINVVASIQSCEALKILSGQIEAINRHWTIINLWDNSIRQIDVSGLHGSGDCPTCDKAEYPWLNGQRASQSAVLCGRNAVQVSPPRDAGQHKLDLALLEKKLSPLGATSRNAFLLRATIDPYTLTIFPNGRAIISGTDEINTAKTVYAKYVGA